jgi:hypothetical protein
MELTEAQKVAFLDKHIPHRLCLLTTFRDRQPWFRERIGHPDCDLLRAAKDSALISIRMFAEFLGLKTVDGKRNGAVFVDMLGGTRAPMEDLPNKERSVIGGLLRRANKELAHLTCDYTGHDEFGTARALVDGINIVERLLREHLYEPLKDEHPFPDLAKEKRFYDDEFQFVDGKESVSDFPRR